jgi:hypothetical protein
MQINDTTAETVRINDSVVGTVEMITRFTRGAWRLEVDEDDTPLTLSSGERRIDLGVDVSDLTDLAALLNHPRVKALYSK